MPHPEGLTNDAILAGDVPLIVMLAIFVFDIFLWTAIAYWLEQVIPSR